MHIPDLNTVWFLLVGILFTGYAILDGFDFGVGILHLFVKKDIDRRILLNSIGPVWDGNEVWLVTGLHFQEPTLQYFRGSITPLCCFLQP